MLERYNELLKRRHLKNADVVRGTGISASTLSEWKKGKYELRLEKIVAIADFLDVSLDYFVTGKERPTTQIDILYSELNDEGKAMLLTRAYELKVLGYIKSSKEVSA